MRLPLHFGHSVTHEMWGKILYAPLVPFCVFFFGRLHEGLAPLAERVRGAAPQEVVETEPAVSIDWRASVISLEAVRYHSSKYKKQEQKQAVILGLKILYDSQSYQRPFLNSKASKRKKAAG